MVEAERRDALVEHLTARGIGTETYYPSPLHLQPCFADLGHRPGQFPVAEAACRHTVALPLYPDLADDDVDVVCAAIRDFYAGRRGMTLPFFPPDLFEADREALLKIVHEVAVSPDQKFILGSRTAEMERALREDTGAADVIACSSGTGGLNLSVAALGIGPGDEVIVPAFCCQPVASSVANAGGTPVFADVDPWTMVMDPADTERRITPRTKAIMPAHVFSIMADMPAFTDIGRRHGLPVGARADAGCSTCRTGPPGGPADRRAAATGWTRPPGSGPPPGYRRWTGRG